MVEVIIGRAGSNVTLHPVSAIECFDIFKLLTASELFGRKIYG